ncbi:phosphatidylinositol glycan class n [Anaeramoeba flamelloides]|uniref:Phosphatidylinositol glycan class n n=1 Tax=Anaeramoeba flamelloides TaxID=1746091 RepID=A0AAV7YTA3_9EUKA|nr:phosphatidylinositol glycan class n [Anaeramoeba flamelloides]
MSTSDFEPFSTNSESDQLNMIGQNNTSSEEDTNSLNKPTVSDTEDVEKNKKKCCCIKSCSEIKLSGASIIGFFGIALGSFFIALHTFGDQKYPSWMMTIPSVICCISIIIGIVKKVPFEVYSFSLISVFFIASTITWNNGFWNLNSFKMTSGVIGYVVFLILILIFSTLLLLSTLFYSQPLFGIVASLNTAIFFLIIRIFSKTHSILIGNMLILTAILSLYFSIGLAVNNSTGKEVFKMGKPIIVTSNKCKKEEDH